VILLKNKTRKEELKQLALKKMDNGGRIYQSQGPWYQ